ncbi:MAG: response regulator [Clostridiales bacterium]|nr:response regulator [Clostridiales bacterium]
MKISQSLKICMTSLLLSIAITWNATAWTIRNISNREGMTNSAALSLCQASDGMLWIGTCDGVNIFDGVHVYPFSQIYPDSRLSGNIIEAITRGRDGEMWIQTNFGLNHVDTSTGKVKVFGNFLGHEILTKNYHDEIFILNEDGHIYVYDPEQTRFKIIERFMTERDRVLQVAIVADRMLLFTVNGVTSTLLVDKGGQPQAGDTDILSSTPLSFAKVNGKNVLTVTDDGKLQVFDLATYSFTDITDLSPLIKERGKISSMAVDRDGNIFISFNINGTVMADRSKGYKPVDLGIEVGVFSLLASDDHEVVWIGSDCGGVYTCFNARHNIITVPFEKLNNIITNPIRCIHIDREKNLWLGTKGSGLLQISDFDTNTARHGAMTLHTSANSGLLHNSVFAIDSSDDSPYMWLGTEEGINIYDKRTHSIYPVESDMEMQWIHGVSVQGDSLLWAASIGKGVFKSRIDKSGTRPRLHSSKQYLVGDRTFSNNYFFSLSTDNQGRPVFANRGMGAYIYDEPSDNLKRIPLRNSYESKTINDVFSILKLHDIIWLGTGNGLVKQTPREERLYNGSNDGFVNSTIHCLLLDHTGDLWISTNQGLINFDPDSGQTSLFDHDNGIPVSEFSDGAAYISPDSVLMFGGIDGLVLVKHNDRYVTGESTESTVKLIGLSINGQNESYNKYIDNKTGALKFDRDQNYLTLLFSTPEFVSTHAIDYLYSLDGREWNRNGADNAISFTNLNPGKHTLHVKSINHDLHTESRPLTLTLDITPRWYESTLAKVVYSLILLGIAMMIVGQYIRRQREKQQHTLDKMQQAHKEELYEEKLKFFTNITHEFCTPITLIQGPCERIMSYENTDEYIRKYTSLIYRNSRRLDNLIQEIIDLRRIETGHSQRKVRHIDVSELCNDTIDTFADMSERTHITVENNVEPGIVWNTDYNSISKIINNLISNAFKYTHEGGTIRVSLKRECDTLRLEVWNTGKGIRPEDRGRIFNRYAILDNIEEKMTHGLSARNGLGMAICHSMVEQLEGSIAIESEVGKYASFIVTLPMLQPDAKEDDTIISGKHPTASSRAVPDNGTSLAPVNNKGTESLQADAAHDMKPTSSRRLLVVDDNVEILSLLKDSLSEYNVTTATNGDEAITLLTDSVYDLIITDVMMPGTDGLSFSKQIKANRHTAHIPLIILSAKTSNDEMIEGIESGADVYIRKPFSFGYLRAMISRLIERSDQLREYYNSSGSAYQYEQGQLVSREDKTFIDGLTTFIDTNIDDSELSIEAMASHLNMSVRNLYRKLKELDMSSPNDLIKDHRMAAAAKLLCTTSLTVQEIMFRTGFSNRSHFYREFAKRYQMTPKEYRTSHQTRDNSLNNPTDSNNR